MQVENNPNTASMSASASGALALETGRNVVARVLEVGNDGSARISLAGQQVAVQSNLHLEPGQTLNLTVGNVADGRVQLQVQTAGSSGSSTGGFPDTSAQLSQFAPSAIRELARAGVPVTAPLAQAVARAVEQLVAMPNGPSADTAARAVANLIARDFALSPAVAGRVVAALDLAGKLGSELSQLAGQSKAIASALPQTAADASALRSTLSTSLSPVELAVARIVQATEAARAALTPGSGLGPAVAAPTSTGPHLVANYVASQIATNVRLDQASQAATTPLPTAPPASGAPTPVTSQLQAQAAQLQGDDAADLIATARGAQTLASLKAVPDALAHTQPPAGTTQPASTGSAAAAAARNPEAGAQVVGGAPTSSPPQLSQVVANLSVSIARFAQALAPAEGAPGAAVAAQAKALSELEGYVPGGSFTPESMGGGPGGTSAALIAALRQASAGSGGAPGGDGNAGTGSALLNTLARYDASQIASALRQMGDQQALALTGQLLATLSDASGSLSPDDQARVRQMVHSMLHDLGRGLAGTAADDHAALRTALELVATSDPRAHVQDQAARILHAMDGQQVLSHPRAGADSGYVYFQVPLPQGQSAEVLVRREPGRRQVSFDTFDIAFLLDTESLGSLMIHLEAHPAAVRATVKTDRPALEPIIRSQADALQASVEAQSGRPVLVSTGVFENGVAPTTLLEPEFGFVPGENVYYA